jgi:hypothetical protein
MMPRCTPFLVAVLLFQFVAGRAVGADNVPAVNVDYPNTAHLRGRVVDERGKPLKGVRVWPHEFHGKLAPSKPTLAEILADVSGVTDEDGKFSIPLHFAGEQLAVANIQVTGRGYVQVMDGLKYRMKAGGEAVADYQLQPGEVLSGTVDPLINGIVEAVFHPDVEFSEVIQVRGKTFDQHLWSDISGTFEVYVPPGRYRITAGSVELEDIPSGTTGIRVRRASPAVSKSQCRAALEALRADMDRHYSYFVLKPDLDWNKLCDEFVVKVERCETRDEFLFQLISMLRRLDDKHIWVEVDGERLPTSMNGWTRNWSENLATQLADVRSIGHFAQIGVTRDGGFGYLSVFDLAATEEETKELLTAMRALRGVPGFIVDLRRCSGGSEPLALQIAQFFCDREVTYAKNKYRNGPRHDAFGPDLDRTLSPSDEPFTKPVACLIGNRTMSSAESFAQMLDALPHAVTIGGRTRGSSGNPAPFALPEIDVKVGYSRWFDMSADGRPVEGQGIAPDILVEKPIEGYRESDPIFLRAIEELRSRVGPK